jgi:hypothetical protein
MKEPVGIRPTVDDFHLAIAQDLNLHHTPHEVPNLCRQREAGRQADGPNGDPACQQLNLMMITRSSIIFGVYNRLLSIMGLIEHLVAWVYVTFAMVYHGMLYTLIIMIVIMGLIENLVATRASIGASISCAICALQVTLSRHVWRTMITSA